MTLRIGTTRALATAIAFVIAAIGLSAVAFADSTPALPSSQLLPGESVRSSLLLPAAPVSVSPWLTVSHVRQTCTARACSRTASLADVLQLTIRAADGASWTRKVSALSGSLPMPGGVLPAHRSAEYRLTLTFPVSADDRYENLAMSANLDWHEQGSAGPVPGSSGSRTITTHVLGEKHVRTASGQIDNSLPLTGFDMLLVVLSAASLMAAGVVITSGGRRRPKQG